MTLPFQHRDTEGTENTEARLADLSGAIIGGAIEVHQTLGAGLLESIYEECLCRELALRGLRVKRQVPVGVKYKGVTLEHALKLDMLVEEQVIVEVKAVSRIEPVHEAQLLSYLRLTNLWLGLLINFDVTVLKNGVRRVVNGAPRSL